MKKALAYNDVYLTPKYSELASRSGADVKVRFGGKIFKLPIMPANMVSCINVEQAKWLSENGYFYVMHRFWKGNDSSFGFCHNAEKENWKTISISVGVKKEDFITVENLAGSFGHIGYEGATRVDFITVDIAHGHSLAMKQMLAHIKSMFKWEDNMPFIIAGNVTTPSAVEDLISWGADAIKVGIGGGGACSTKNKTGFHMPMFTAVKSCADISSKPIIADGGIRENADFAKALVAGAKMVMAGSVFTACIDSPAENIYSKSYTKIHDLGHADYKGPITHKHYFGSASAKNKGHKNHIEGLEIEIPCNGMTYAEKLTEIEQDLRSSVSYAGGKDLSSLKNVDAIYV